MHAMTSVVLNELAARPGWRAGGSVDWRAAAPGAGAGTRAPPGRGGGLGQGAPREVAAARGPRGAPQRALVRRPTRPSRLSSSTGPGASSQRRRAPAPLRGWCDTLATEPAREANVRVGPPARPFLSVADLVADRAARGPASRVARGANELAQRSAQVASWLGVSVRARTWRPVGTQWKSRRGLAAMVAARRDSLHMQTQAREYILDTLTKLAQEDVAARDCRAQRACELRARQRWT